MKEYITQQIEHDKLIDKLIDNEIIDLAGLPSISSDVRKTLLSWITRCMQQENRQIQTQTGRMVKLLWNKENKSFIKLSSDDGEFVLPAMKLKVTAARVK